MTHAVDLGSNLCLHSTSRVKGKRVLTAGEGMENMLMCIHLFAKWNTTIDCKLIAYMSTYTTCGQNFAVRSNLVLVSHGQPAIPTRVRWHDFPVHSRNSYLRGARTTLTGRGRWCTYGSNPHVIFLRNLNSLRPIPCAIFRGSKYYSVCFFSSKITNLISQFLVFLRKIDKI